MCRRLVVRRDTRADHYRVFPDRIRLRRTKLRRKYRNEVRTIRYMCVRNNDGVIS